jgi:hypothetical protein
MKFSRPINGMVGWQKFASKHYATRKMQSLVSQKMMPNQRLVNSVLKGEFDRERRDFGASAWPGSAEVSHRTSQLLGIFGANLPAENFRPAVTGGGYSLLRTCLRTNSRGTEKITGKIAKKPIKACTTSK